MSKPTSATVSPHPEPFSRIVNTNHPGPGATQQEILPNSSFRYQPSPGHSAADWSRNDTHFANVSHTNVSQAHGGIGNMQRRSGGLINGAPCSENLLRQNHENLVPFQQEMRHREQIMNCREAEFDHDWNGHAESDMPHDHEQLHRPRFQLPGLQAASEFDHRSMEEQPLRVNTGENPNQPFRLDRRGDQNFQMPHVTRPNPQIQNFAMQSRAMPATQSQGNFMLSNSDPFHDDRIANSFSPRIHHHDHHHQLDGIQRQHHQPQMQPNFAPRPGSHPMVRERTIGERSISDDVPFRQPQQSHISPHSDVSQMDRLDFQNNRMQAQRPMTPAQVDQTRFTRPVLPNIQKLEHDHRGHLGAHNYGSVNLEHQDWSNQNNLAGPMNPDSRFSHGLSHHTDIPTQVSNASFRVHNSPWSNNTRQWNTMQQDSQIGYRPIQSANLQFDSQQHPLETIEHRWPHQNSTGANGRDYNWGFCFASWSSLNCWFYFLLAVAKFLYWANMSRV